MIYLIHCKNLCKCYNVLPPGTIITKKNKEKGKQKEREKENILQDVIFKLKPKHISYTNGN
jgi:hypothetical protein